MVLDNRDKKILRLLLKNGRMSNKELALEIALSPSACFTRVKTLENMGYITGYYAKLGTKLLNKFEEVIVQIKLTSHDIKIIKKFEEKITQFSSIIQVDFVSGDYDYIIRMVAVDNIAYHRQMDEILQADINIDKYRSNFITKKVKPYQDYYISLIDD